MSASMRWSVQGRPINSTDWLALARDAEGAGCNALYVADHPGTSAAPFVALAAAAAVTERMKLGTCVLNAGLWEPFALASQVATLNMVSGGRALLGMGAGHTPAEWTMIGQSMPPPARRVDRLIEVTEAVQQILVGESVSRSGRGVELDQARLDEPKPAQTPIPLMVGGNGPRLVRFAARTADIVGISGLSRTLPDGHTHEVEWSGAALDRSFELVRSTAADAGRSSEIEVLVQHVEITTDADSAAARIAPLIVGATPSDLRDAPFIWIGTPSQIAHQLRAHQDRWGISRYVVRQNAFAATAEVMRAFHSEH